MDYNFMKMNKFYKQIVCYAVRIAIDDENNTLCGTGTLFPISGRNEMYILTAAHVAEPLKKGIQSGRHNIYLTYRDDLGNINSVIVDDANHIFIHSKYNDGNGIEKENDYFFDVALIRVPWEEWMNKCQPYMLKEGDIGNDFSGYGFPESLEWEKDQTQAGLFSGIGRLLCDIEYVDDGRLAVNYNLLAERDIPREYVVDGFSGTGLFSKGQMGVYYRGIFSCSRGDRAAGYKAWATDASIIAELFRENNIDIEHMIFLGEDVAPIEEDCTSFSYMINQIKDKEESKNAFHYLNPENGFWGREDEMNALEDFINDRRDILFMAIAAPGGCGKSKLVYEFIRKHKSDCDWKMQYVGKAQIQRLMTFSTYTYSKNLLLIIDYAGLYAKELGEWLHHIGSLRTVDRPSKVRLLILERSQGCEIDNSYIPPAWINSFLGTGERKERLHFYWYKNEVFRRGWQLKPLSDEAIIILMERFAQINGKNLSQETIQKLLQYLKRKEKNNNFAARPLIAMFLVDAFVRGHSVFSWNMDGIMEHFMERFDTQWEQLCGGNKALKEAVSNCVFFATATGGLDLEEPPKYLQSSIEQLENLEDNEYINLISAVNQNTSFKNCIFPLEPDIVGEYFLFKKMQKMALRKSKMKEVMKAIWSEPLKCFEVFARSIYDYGRNPVFRDFYIQHLNDLMPLDCNDLEIEAHSRLLHMMMITFNGTKKKLVIIDKLKELYQVYPEHQVLKGDYAAALMLEAGYRYFLKPREQEQCTEEVARLYQENRDSNYIQIIYGKCLGNQIQGYIECRRPGISTQLRTMIDNRLEHYICRLIKLGKECPDNKMIEETMVRMNVMLKHPNMNGFKMRIFSREN